MIPHLAISSHDLDQTIKFYELWDFEVTERYEGYVILEKPGFQLVAHFIKEKLPFPKSQYPNHLGVVIIDKLEFDWLCDYFITLGNGDKYTDLITRYEGTSREQKAFYLLDPSNNVFEVKWYKEPKATETLRR